MRQLGKRLWFVKLYLLRPGLLEGSNAMQAILYHLQPAFGLLSLSANKVCAGNDLPGSQPGDSGIDECDAGMTTDNNNKVLVSQVTSAVLDRSQYRPRKFEGGVCCGGHLAVTYGGELLYLRICS